MNERLQKTHPFQYSLANSSIKLGLGLGSTSEQSVIDSILLEICSVNSNKICLFNFEQLDRPADVYEDDQFCWNEISCLEKSLSFADDLIMAVDNSLQKFVEQKQKSSSDLIVKPVTQVVHNQSNKSQPHVVDILKDTSTLGRETSFKTGKDMYTSEGGKFEPKQTGNKRNNEGNLVSGALRASTSSSSLPTELEHCDKALVDRIEADIIHSGQPVRFEDISGLEFAKKCVTELICWPMSRPDLFQGLRALPRGLLLFGPPGTGKTLIGKAIAHQSGATFFSISASSLMSKWIGEGEKLVRTLFEVAAYRQPAVVFMDEVDALLCQRSSEENEASRRMKTEFMVQLDGAGTSQSARVVVVGATNRPEELDEAVRRRFVKRIYIPLPDDESRRQLFITLLQSSRHGLCTADLVALVEKTAGYSGADIRSLCTEAAMGPVREIAEQRRGDLKNISNSDVPPISISHFMDAVEAVLPTVSSGDLQRYIDWNSSFGSFRRMT